LNKVECLNYQLKEQIKKKDDEIKEHQMMVEERDVRLKKIQKKFEKQAETLSMITKLSNNIQDSQ